MIRKMTDEEIEESIKKRGITREGITTQELNTIAKGRRRRRI